MEKDTNIVQSVIIADDEADIHTREEASASPLEWSEEEERRLVRKIDMVVLPLLMLGFMALQYDRGNIGNALTDHFLHDISITQSQFNTGQQLLQAGIVLLELPSNLLLYRLDPHIFLGTQILAWGLVALFQAFQYNLAGFLSTRLLLGVCESGFIPGALWTIGNWYRREESSKRFSLFFAGNLAAAVSGGVVAYGVLQMRGVLGLAGWQWLFIIEGLFTIIVGIVFLALCPKAPADPVSLLGMRFFDERETAILVERVLRDDPSKVKKGNNVSRAELASALTNWRIYPHLLLTITAFAPSFTLTSYAPSIVISYGYGRLQSNALASVGTWIALVLSVTWGVLADKTRCRGLWVLAGLVLWWGFTLGCLLLTESTSSTKRYILLVLAMSFTYVWHPINGAWLALNARSAGERSITMAMFIMAANTSGIIGGQLFQAKDAPRYHVGWTAIVGLVSGGVLFGLLANVQYRVLNHRSRMRTAKDDQLRLQLYKL